LQTASGPETLQTVLDFCARDPTHVGCRQIEAAARVNENLLRLTDGLTIRKVIVVPGKLVNIVAS